VQNHRHSENVCTLIWGTHTFSKLAIIMKEQNEKSWIQT